MSWLSNGVEASVYAETQNIGTRCCLSSTFHIRLPVGTIRLVASRMRSVPVALAAPPGTLPRRPVLGRSYKVIQYFSLEPQNPSTA